MLSSTKIASDQNTDTSSHSQTSTGLLDSLWYGYKITGDNLEMNIKPCHMTSEDTTRSFTAFICYLFEIVSQFHISAISHQCLQFRLVQICCYPTIMT